MYTFEDIKNNVVPLLNLFEANTIHDTGVGFISGGFANTDYDYMEEEDEGYLYFTLKWGVQSDVEDTVYTEHYQIAIENLLKEIPTNQKLNYIQDA